MRNPWGVSTYTGPWNYADPKWTPELLAQVPMNLGNEVKN